MTQGGPVTHVQHRQLHACKYRVVHTCTQPRQPTQREREHTISWKRSSSDLFSCWARRPVSLRTFSCSTFASLQFKKRDNRHTPVKKMRKKGQHHRERLCANICELVWVLSLSLSLSLSVSLCVHVYVYTCVSEWVWVCLYMNSNMYMYTHVCVSVLVSIYVGM